MAASSGLGVGIAGRDGCGMTMMLGTASTTAGLKHLGGPDRSRMLTLPWYTTRWPTTTFLVFMQQHPELLLGQRGHLRPQQFVNVHVGGADRWRAGRRPERSGLGTSTA